MKLEATVLAVKNLEVSKQFYMQLFDQKIILDHGLNITFDGGFALQKDFAWLVDVPSDWVCDKACNMELYFEVDDFDKALKLTKMLEAFSEDEDVEKVSVNCNISPELQKEVDEFIEKNTFRT